MEKLAILDCGGQYTKVIDRKVRELGVCTDIFPIGVPTEQLAPYGALILSGGPASVWSEQALTYDPALFDLGKPILGICYGMQLITEHFGGVVAPAVKTEYGQTEIDVDTSCPLFRGLEPRQAVLMSHGDAVTSMPHGFYSVATSGSIIAGIYNPDTRIAGVQFHPEVEPTVNGMQMLNAFLREICGFTETYALEDRIETSIRRIREQAGEEGKVVVLVSGGVDSAVTAALLVRALSADRVFAIHVDHGLMRKNESDLICRNLSELGLVNIRRINAEDAFFHTRLTLKGKTYPPLCEATDPEEKRAIIGHMFFVVTEQAAQELHLDFDRDFLAQGTLRPDLIESGNPLVSGYAHKIKTHHNDVGIIRALRERGRVIETNWDWHKDEVRKVARMLGLREEIAQRQPFPGPGLGVRLICCDRAADLPAPAVQEQVRAYAAEEGYTLALGPIRSVGVQGDNRSYKTLATLYGGNPMGADWSRIFDLARRIPNKFDCINRVAYRIDSTAAAAPMECPGLHINHESADLLREVDHIVTEVVTGPSIAQRFAVLFPATCPDRPGRRYACAIRAVVTGDFMTARSAVPGQDFPLTALDEAVRRIRAAADADISMIFYDVTGKPPATVEWE